MADPVGDELVASLARPGGNVTGTTFLGPELVAKRLQLLRDVVPGLARVAALWHPHAYGEHTMASVVKDIEGAARTLGMQLQLVPANGPDDLASAFSTMAKERAGAFIVLPSPMLFGEHRRIIRLIQKWLKAGILEDGVVAVSDRGTGQGSVISPLLANIYLHYSSRVR